MSRRRLFLTFGSLAIIAANAGAASAQLTTGAPSTFTFDNYVIDEVPSPGTFTHFNLIATDASTSNFVDLRLTGDWDYRLPRLPGNGQVSAGGVLPLTVGNVPVQIDDYGITTDAKWVNGGGAADTPISYMRRFTGIVERLNPADTDGPLVAAGSIEDVLHGNGSRIFHSVFTAGTPTSYILAANTDYLIYYGVITNFGNQTFDPERTPTVTITNEFGGDLGDSFRGFDATFSWHAVPEPSSLLHATMCLMAFGWAVTKRRHLRPKSLSCRGTASRLN